MNVTVLAGWVLALGGTPTGETSAAAPVAESVEVTGECPSRQAVIAALIPALGKPAAQPDARPPRVTDLGDKFEIAAYGQVRQYTDLERNCGERARVAAVFITLALDPPTFELFAGPPSPSIVAPLPPPPPPPAAVGSEPWMDVCLGGRLDGAATEDVAGGAELRFAVGSGAFGLAAAAGILSATERTSTSASVTVRQQRFPASASAVARHQLSPSVELTGALGLAVVPFTARGSGLSPSTPATRLDVGGRVAVDLRLRLGAKLAAFAGVHVEAFPRAYALEVAPLGSVGSTARFWAGTTVGVAFDVR